jgi:DNA-binding protein H-NS
MKNRWYLFVPLVIIVTLISTGCGISRSQYDAVSIELNLVKQDKQALQAKLDQAQSELTLARTDQVRTQVGLETAQGQLQSAQADRQAAQTQLQAVQSQLQTAQSQLTANKADLQSVQAQVQTLQNALNAAKSVPAKALSYAEFMDILMFEVWMGSGVTPNFIFLSEGEWKSALRNRAASIGDATLVGFVNELEKGTITKNTLYSMAYYCLAKIEATLK